MSRAPRVRPPSSLLARALAVALAAGGAACASDGPPADGPVDAGVVPIDAPLVGFEAPALVCPGGPGCESAGDGVLHVGAAARVFSPTITEPWTDTNGDLHWQPSEPFVDADDDGELDGFWLFGGNRPAMGVKTDVEARALAFRQGDTTVAIVYVDAIGLLLGDIEAIRASPVLAGVDLDHVVVGATHAHDTPDSVGLWGRTPLETGRRDEHIAALIEASASAVREAVEGAAPAHLVIGKTLLLNDPDDPTSRTDRYNKDIRDPVIFDPTLTVARFVRADDAEATIGTLVSWGCHPEVSHFGDEPPEVTAHFPHWVRTVVEDGLLAGALHDLEADLPGLGGVTVYVQGALGGQVGSLRGTAPVGPDGELITEESHAMDQAIGTNVARRALEILRDEGETVGDLPLTVRSAVFHGRVDNSAFQLAFQIGVVGPVPLTGYDPEGLVGAGNEPWVPLRSTYVQVGPLGMVTVPGELHPELWVGGYDGSWSWGWELLDASEPNAPDLATAPAPPYLRDLVLENPGVSYPIVAGLAEGYVGYIVPSYNYVLHETDPYFEEAEGQHYEEVFSLGPAVEAHAIHPILELVGLRP